MLKLIPLLSRPGVLAFKNSWFNISFFHKNFWQNFFAILCVTYLLWGLYQLSFQGFSLLHEHRHLTNAFLPAVFNALIFALLIIVFFSSCGFSLTCLYLSEDLELILASPLSKLRFFVNKFIQILLGSSWIICIGSIPCVIALNQVYQSGPKLYLYLALLLFPLLISPVATGIICATLITRFFTGRYLRIVLPILTVALLLIVFNKSHSFLSKIQNNDINDLTGVLQNLENFDNSFIALSSFGNVVAGATLNNMQSGQNSISYLYFIALTLLLLSYTTVSVMHNTSLAKIRHTARNPGASSQKTRQLIKFSLPFRDKIFRGMMLKEFKIFARDFSHLIQVSIILIICVFYLYNFQTIFQSQEYFSTSLNSWKYATFLCNIAFGNLIIISLSTRFVYSSLSLEGQSFWILTSSPLSVQEILKQKFRIWYYPVVIFSSVILISGCFALQADEYFILLTFCCGLVLAHSTTALAIALGAFFANFNWTHSTQIVTSSGSLIYIGSAILLTIINVIILASLLSHDFLRSQMGFSYQLYYSLTAISAILFVVGNYIFSNLFLKFGAANLAKKIL